MLKPGRLEAISDGIIAIAMTLLVLGLEVPSVHDVPEKELTTYLVDSSHSLVGFVISFLLVGTYWVQHYVLFHYVATVDRPFIALNGLFLLAISFVPFPTGLQATYRHDELAMILYAISQALCGTLLLALWVYATRIGRLVDASISPQIVAGMTQRLSVTPIVGLAAVGASFVSLDLTRVMFLAIPIAYLSQRAVDGGWAGPDQDAEKPHTD